METDNPNMVEHSYAGYAVEIHRHPIYGDYEYVVKKDQKVEFASSHPFEDAADALANACMHINNAT